MVILFCTCKKYPEDAKFPWQTVQKRLTGTFIVDQYIVNNIDSTYLLPPCNAVYPMDHTSNDGHYYFKFSFGKGLEGNISGLDGNGSFSFSNDKNKLLTSYAVKPGKYNLINPAASILSTGGEWEIRKLTDKEFWIKLSFDGLTNTIHLKKVSNT